MFKKKNPCIKHKLWGRLKNEAHWEYRIVPDKDFMDWYKIEYWCVDHYSCSNTVGISCCLTLEEAKEKIEERREHKFYELCAQALYNRRKARVENL